VYPALTTWNRPHRRWLAGQTFEHAPTELAFIDQLAAIDGLRELLHVLAADRIDPR
jgi:hypothetical protein